MNISREIENNDLHKIRERAYQLWEEAGRPECDGKEFWLRAEVRIRIEEIMARRISKISPFSLICSAEHVQIELDVLEPKISHDEPRTSNQDQIEQARERLKNEQGLY